MYKISLQSINLKIEKIYCAKNYNCNYNYSSVSVVDGSRDWLGLAVGSLERWGLALRDACGLGQWALLSWSTEVATLNCSTLNDTCCCHV